MRRVGINPDDVLLPPMSSSVVFEDGSRRLVKLLKTHYPTPLYLVRYMFAVGRMSFTDILSGILPTGRMFAFEHKKDFDRFDGISIYEYLQQHGSSQAIHEFVISPFSRSFAFASTQELSAGAVISGLTFYFIGHQDDVLTRWCRGNPQELLIDPIANFITGNGGIIRTNSAVTGIEIDEDENETGESPRITAVSVGAALREFRVSLSEIPADRPLVRDLEPGLRILVRKAGDQFSALQATCTHAGGIVDFVPALNCFECPRHQGRFDLDGNVLSPPPARPLEKLPVRIGDTAEIRVKIGHSVKRVQQF